MKVKEITEKEIDPLFSNNYFYGSEKRKEFRSKYSEMESENIDWLELCQDAQKYNSHKYGFYLVVKLLELGLYQGSYKERLQHNLPVYLKLIGTNFHFKEVLCGDQISKTILCFNNHNPYGDEMRLSCYFVDTSNLFLVNLLEKHLNERKSFNPDNFNQIVQLFGKSLGVNEEQIRSELDFTPSMLLDQANYYKRFFEDNKKLKYLSLSFIIHFYRWMVQSNPEYDYFKNELHLSETLLFSRSLATFLQQDYYFTTYNPENIPYGKKRICFILKGLEGASTLIKNDDYKSFDFSGLTSEFYRNLLLEFVMMSPISAFAHLELGNPIVTSFEKLYQIKQNPIYPNKELNHLTNQEAVFIREIFDSQNVSIRVKNNRIGAVRRFINFCVDKNAITVDNLFFDYLRQYEEPNKNTAKTVPDEDLTKLNQYFLEKSKNDLVYKEIYVIFHLLLQTEFRISQICHLQIDCIQPTVKPNQFEILSNSKTSHGKKNRYVISSMTYNLLMDIIEETETIRENCPVDSMKQYVFLYEAHRTKQPVVFANDIFAPRMRKACDELKIARYNASNLRDTHMTKSLEHIMRNGKSDMEMSVLSKHRYMDTTKNHYIEMELEKMLEATYGITIGTELIETDSKIVDEIPESLKGNENDVENGCGKCTAESCVMTDSLPCMACKHFITTVNHEVYFKKAIESVERLIGIITNAHDKEDLITIKTLYVLYLKAINLHKEGIVND